MEAEVTCGVCHEQPALPGEPTCLRCNPHQPALGEQRITWLTPPTHVGRERWVHDQEGHYDRNYDDAIAVAYGDRRFVVDYTRTQWESPAPGTTVSRAGIFVNGAETSDRTLTGLQGRGAPVGGHDYDWVDVSAMLESLGLVRVGTTAEVQRMPRTTSCPCSVNNRSSESRGVGAALTAWMRLNALPGQQDRFVVAVTGSIPCEHCMSVIDYLNSRSN